MNSVKTITLQLLRAYGTKPAFETAGIRKKLTAIKAERNPKISFKNIDENDPEMYESDLVDAADTHTMYDRKMEKSKKLLPYHIVKDKYFKQVEPSFLTFIEKDQIKTLHASDPEEWTVEKLSKSFPALPETIKKVLRSHWLPKSVDTIIKYDTKVIENWKNFKTNKLAVNPALKQHLMKFRNRKISLPDRESLERFVLPPIELPKPKIKYFLNIIEENVDSKQHTCNEQLVSSEKNKRNLITDGKKTVELRVEQGSNSNKLVPSWEKHGQNREKLVFTEFIKKKLNDSHDVSLEEKEVLLSTYRKHIESTNLEDVSSNVLNKATKHVTDRKDKSITRSSSDENALTVQSEKQSKIATETSSEHSSLDTYVKERHSLMDTNFDYAKRIKIPENAYKEGMTYRINDCYYDDDGEFLFRTPGLRA